MQITSGNETKHVWLHVDDETRVKALSMLEPSMIERKRKNVWNHTDEHNQRAKKQKTNDDVLRNKIALLRRENKALRTLTVRDEDVEEMDDEELIEYELTLKRQLKDIAREISKLYQEKNYRGF